MRTVIKRDGSEVSFNSGKIKTAILNAMLETKDGINEKLAADIANMIENQVERSERKVHVEDIQDLVEDFLMASERKDAAKKYIIYRYEETRQETPGNAEMAGSFPKILSASISMRLPR